MGRQITLEPLSAGGYMVRETVLSEHALSDAAAIVNELNAVSHRLGAVRQQMRTLKEEHDALVAYRDQLKTLL